MQKNRIHQSFEWSMIAVWTVLLLLFFCQAAQSRVQALPQQEAADVFARIDGQVITRDEFEQIFNAAVRHKYYHGRVPDEEIEEFRKQVARDTISQILVYREALKAGLKPDDEKINEGIEKYNQRYAGSSEWQKMKSKVLPLLKLRLQRQDLIEKMRSRVMDINPPSTAQVRKYYRDHPEKFTEPGRIWISVILLGVPPSAGRKVWEDAEKAALQFRQRILAGEDFAKIARKYSTHPSAVNGGDLGYLHQGMLEGDAQKAVSQLEVNQITEPVFVLEGVALFRLNGIQSDKKMPFAKVQNRARELLIRELKDKAWRNYRKELLDRANILVNKDIYDLEHD